ncbi:alpha/beta fold hydrolase [Salipiger mangrovisoli]|uniref:Alpha/beta hydrolase n=1 Tax=Salipiger mangrovisoli TaxID=2865933 RepID=A0ABR9X4W4_9RHOB|nr:alpha/beta hydrolase [Salipiger mangrovisoli]MBE9638599.1 alpha/beta hydrolase [Salipiger mangrovisoli]
MSAVGEITRQATRLACYRAGSGPKVLFQHGLGGDEAQVAALFPEDVPVTRLTLECRGHGRSDAGAGGWSFDQFAEDLEVLLSREGSGPLVLGGVSMGAALALKLAVARPERVRGLILLRPAWGAGPVRDNMAPVAEAARRLGAGETGVDGTVLARDMAEAPDNLASLRGYFTRPNAAAFAPVLAAMAADDPGLTEAQIASLAMPALILSAPRDLIHPAALAAELAGLLPKAILKPLPDKAADPQAHREAARAAISDFLAQLD